eukprot:TRINITY_DN9892_c0_g1_i1.p1 TRINITY_DN9892_c0_g1~~TRINITY_DN9892_c0_g1_i1.p1  ORF type:complete len:236 (-),score=50.66 TRINITY_DN9892_c0_g1_i1:36-743(-)
MADHHKHDNDDDLFERLKKLKESSGTTITVEPPSEDDLFDRFRKLKGSAPVSQTTDTKQFLFPERNNLTECEEIDELMNFTTEELEIGTISTTSTIDIDADLRARLDSMKKKPKHDVDVDESSIRERLNKLNGNNTSFEPSLLIPSSEEPKDEKSQIEQLLIQAMEENRIESMNLSYKKQDENVKKERKDEGETNRKKRKRRKKRIVVELSESESYSNSDDSSSYSHSSDSDSDY